MTDNSHKIHITTPTTIEKTNFQNKTQRESIICSEIGPITEFSDKQKVSEILVSMSANNEHQKVTKVIIQSRKRLLKIYHALICANVQNERLFTSQRDRDRSISHTRKCEVCPALSDCSSMKSLLVHIYSCSDGTKCRFPECITTKTILIHHTNCLDKKCPLCVPIRNNIYRKNAVMKYNANLLETAKCTLSKRPMEETDLFERYAKKSKQRVTFALDFPFQNKNIL
uniref:histone acetyltransferase n=1 Tax=Corethron hystrix TaxID=216773 RepID=A0A7S1FZ61_9STRA